MKSGAVQYYARGRALFHARYCSPSDHCADSDTFGPQLFSGGATPISWRIKLRPPVADGCLSPFPSISYSLNSQFRPFISQSSCPQVSMLYTVIQSLGSDARTLGRPIARSVHHLSTVWMAGWKAHPATVFAIAVRSNRRREPV